LANSASSQRAYAFVESPSAINREASASVAPNVAWLRKRYASAFETGGAAAGPGKIEPIIEPVAPPPPPPQAAVSPATASSKVMRSARSGRIITTPDRVLPCTET
jgi:hypothetical protein